jgi:hypothetical protein
MNKTELRKAIRAAKSVYVTVIATPDDTYDFRVSKAEAYLMLKELDCESYKATVLGDNLYIG